MSSPMSILVCHTLRQYDKYELNNVHPRTVYFPRSCIHDRGTFSAMKFLDDKK